LHWIGHSFGAHRGGPSDLFLPKLPSLPLSIALLPSLGSLVVWPEDYMPKCRDGEALRVPLEKACARVEAAAGKEAGARRRLTGVATAYSCLPHYRIPVTGTDGRVTFPYHSETLLSEGDERATMALVVLHGAYRDADSYFCAMCGGRPSSTERHSPGAHTGLW